MAPVYLLPLLFALLAAARAGALGSPSSRADLFELSLIHYNDFHARFEQTSWTSGTCSAELAAADKCVGGFPRLYTAVTEMMGQRPNAVLLNAGDNYQGTLWYTVHKWEVMVEFMNKLPHDAMGLGNHEFDDKIAGVVPYLEQLNCPVLAANIDDSKEPTFQGKVKESVTVQRGGRDIGIVGYMLSTTNEISSTGNLTFTDEVEAVNRVASQLKKDGVDIIIALSHSGIDVDIIVAEQCPDVDIIVGGHSHTLLYTGTPPGGDYAYDTYPLVVTQTSGRKVLVVQAQAYSKYLGNLTVMFDAAGEVAEWSGNPIILDSTVEEDATMLVELEPWRLEVAALSEEVIGATKVLLDKSTCSMGECNMGNFITDAMVYEHTNTSQLGKSWTHASMAATNSGGIRTSIDEIATGGVITYGDLAMVQPFQNTFDVVELQGKYILEALEFSVSRPYSTRNQRVDFSGQGFLQWSGLRVTFDMNQPIGSRVVPGVTVMCSECRVPRFEPLDPDKYYRIVMNSFLVDGGDAYVVIRDNYRNREFGRLDTDVLRDYLASMSPIIQDMDGRTQMIQSTGSNRENTPSGSTAVLASCLAVLTGLMAYIVQSI